MESATAVLFASFGVFVCLLAFRFITAWENITRRKADAEYARSAQFAAMAKKSHAARRANKKKENDEEEDNDEDDDDPLAPILAHPAVRAIAGRYGINVDAVELGDPAEIERVVGLLNRVPGSKAPQQTQGALL